ncbi:DNA-directed RNA polymerase subunit beta', partial [gut metagenome]
LKENVIVGRLIPAGTGLAYHKAHKAREMAEKQDIEMSELQITPEPENPFLEPTSAINPFASAMGVSLAEEGEEDEASPADALPEGTEKTE